MLVPGLDGPTSADDRLASDLHRGVAGAHSENHLSEESCFKLISPSQWVVRKVKQRVDIFVKVQQPPSEWFTQ